MNKVLISLYNDIDNNKRLIDDAKGIIIRDFIRNDRSLYLQFEPFINDFNFEFFGDICNMTYDDVKKYYIKYFNGEYACNKYLKDLKNTMHFHGLIFKNEFRELNLDDEFAGILLGNIKDFPSRVYRALYRNNVYTLGDLLSLEYSDLVEDKSYRSKIRGVGDKGVSQVVDYVHKIGYLFKNEENSYDYIIKQYRDNNVLLIEDIIDTTLLCNILYSHHIFTVDTLKNVGIEVLELPGVGKKHREYLKNLLCELDGEYKNEVDEICNSIELLLIKLSEFSNGKKEELENKYRSILKEIDNTKCIEQEINKILVKNDKK